MLIEIKVVLLYFDTFKSVIFESVKIKILSKVSTIFLMIWKCKNPKYKSKYK